MKAHIAVNELEVYENKMDALFLEFLNKLKNSKSYHRNELPQETKKLRGIYVFYNNADEAIYVGRTNDLKSRIQYHTRSGSKSGSATYAFNLAKLDFEKNHGKTEKKRKELDNDDNFNIYFNNHKNALYDSKIRYLEIKNDVLQTMLEPYFAYKLKTYPYKQTFENH